MRNTNYDVTNTSRRSLITQGRVIRISGFRQPTNFRLIRFRIFGIILKILSFRDNWLPFRLQFHYFHEFLMEIRVKTVKWFTEIQRSEELSNASLEIFCRFIRRFQCAHMGPEYTCGNTNHGFFILEEHRNGGDRHCGGSHC